MTGVGEYLKEKNPNVKVVAVEPATSPVLSKGTPGIKDALWIKPVEGGVALYVQNGGWKPLKVVDDKSTVSTGDDKPKAIITVTNII